METPAARRASISDGMPLVDSPTPPPGAVLGRIALERVSAAELAEQTAQQDEITRGTGSVPAIDNPPTEVVPRSAAPTRVQRSSNARLALIIGAPLVVLALAGGWLLFLRKPEPVAVVEIPLPPPPPVVVAPPPPEPEPEPVKPPPVAVRTIAGKPMVLEYGAAGEAVEGANPAIVAKARAASLAGDKRLAAKDPKGALKLYRASLKIYPAYLGAYRGMGRALAASGDKKGAIKVLSAYVKIAPEAADADEINKLIEKLGKKPPTRRK